MGKLNIISFWIGIGFFIYFILFNIVFNISVPIGVKITYWFSFFIPLIIGIFSLVKDKEKRWGAITAIIIGVLLLVLSLLSHMNNQLY